MIKKLLICLSLAFLPVVAMAAASDVSLGTSAIISINDPLGNAVPLTVTGSADVVESLTVGATNFSVTLQSGSTLTVSSAGRNLITTDAPSVNSSISCGSSSSSIVLTATAQVTISVSVSANACGTGTAATTSTGSNGPIAQSGGGGGGGSTNSNSITPAVTATTTTSTSTNTTTSGLQSQIANLLALIASLQAQLGTANGPIIGAGVSAFAKNMNVGSRGNDVLNLQRVLNSDSDTKVASNGAGSPGKETTLFGPATKKAVQKFQIKYGIAKPGDTGYGNFGPKTRAKALEVAKSKGL